MIKFANYFKKHRLMIKVRGLQFLVLMLSIIIVKAQNVEITLDSDGNEVKDNFPVFTYGKEVVYSDEFMRVFNKNNRSEEAPTKEEIEEYLDLYVKFKLKVAEAYDRKMDTIPSFINELAGYRRQLAKPYLSDKNVTEKLIREAYDRGLQEVNASHLLVAVPMDAKVEDTLKAYNKIVSLRSRIVDGGEPFEQMAENFSEDPSAKTNKGNLGYFTSFQMIYAFENEAFTLESGNVSQPIRTQFGYHLVKVNDKRKALGDIKVAHIMIKYYNEGQIDSTKRRIDAVFEKLKNGGDWNTLTEEFSEDYNTNARGGELNWFNRTTSNIPAEFKDIAYELKNNGDFSKPVKTQFGWHIVKKVDSKPIPSFEDSKELIRRKVERDSRSALNKEVVVKRIKIENKFVEVGGLAAVIDKIGEEVLNGQFNKPKSEGKLLFNIADKQFAEDDFYAYLATNKKRTNLTLPNYLSKVYNDFVVQYNLDYEEQILEEKYRDFKYIMQEYKDGILLFELTDQEVWSKAVEDTAGLAKFYAENQTNYTWGERANATIYSCKDAKTAKKAMKLAGKGLSPQDLMTKLTVKDALAITYENKKFEKGSNSLLDKIEWKEGIYKLDEENDRIKFVKINEMIAPGPKPLKVNLGQATSDYQAQLEKEWIEELKLKYPVVIYTDNVKKLY